MVVIIKAVLNSEGICRQVFCDKVCFECSTEGSCLYVCDFVRIDRNGFYCTKEDNDNDTV